MPATLQLIFKHEMYLNNYSSLWLICGASLKGISMTSCVCNDMRILCATLHSVSRTHRETKSRKTFFWKGLLHERTFSPSFLHDLLYTIPGLFGNTVSYSEMETMMAARKRISSGILNFSATNECTVEVATGDRPQCCQHKVGAMTLFHQARPDCCSWLVKITCSFRFRPSQQPQTLRCTALVRGVRIQAILILVISVWFRSVIEDNRVSSSPWS